MADGEDGEPEAVAPALPGTADAVVIGAGIVGACCALDLAERGLSVLVLERGAIASATTASGEGNLLVSDKLPGPELTLAQLSLALWRDLPARLGVPAAGDLRLEAAGDLELEDKGGIMVARTEPAASALRALAADQRAAGVTAHDLDPAAALDLEPELNPDLVAAVHYPEDLQVNPVLAATATLAAARRRGATVVPGAEVTSITRSGQTLSVKTPLGTVSTPAVVIAAGPWSGQVAKAAGASLPVEPRRGLVLVTEPLPPIVRHKVYDAGYLAAVGADDAEMHAAAVVEATRAGTVLIGSTRQRVGFDRTVPVAALRLLAAGAVALFPALRAARAIRAYGGFRPYSPDHLPVIGPASDLPGLWYATGHEGAGIGLATGTAHLLAAQLTGATPDLDPAPYLPDRPGLRS